MRLATLGFDADYEVRLLDGAVPTHVHEFRLQRAGTSSGGLVLETGSTSICYEIEPKSGKKWVGRFWGGAEGLDGLFGTPSPTTLCVVVRGQGYWVRVHEPSVVEVIHSIPIKRVLPLLEYSMLVFVDFTRLVAYGAQGFRWSTVDLSWDGLKNIEINGSKICGTGWDSPADRDVPFTVDVNTGNAEGGSSPAKYGASS